MRIDSDDRDALAVVNRLDIDSRLAIGNAAAQFCAVIDANFELDEDRVSKFEIELAYKLFQAQCHLRRQPNG